MSRTETLSGWGRWPRQPCRISAPAEPNQVHTVLGPSAIARGLGRAYGDCAMNEHGTVFTRRLDRMLEFDAGSGVLTAEAGVSLAGIIEVFLPRGYFPPVVPGTRYVSTGGAIAADVHGKNHHVSGSFGDHVVWIDLLCGDGLVRRCSPDEHGDLFHATLGGMGLTGIVLRAAVRLMPVETGWVRQRTIVATDLDEAIAAFEANLASTYSVAWIDCMARGAARGRSLVVLGEHARSHELPPATAADPFRTPRRTARRIPADLPSWAMNPLSVRAFNAFYHRAGRRRGAGQLVTWESYFFPLDAVLDWNRIYGRRGFAQHQCALPLSTARDGLAELLDAVSASGLGSVLAVLKRLGPGAPERPLSFPVEGYTLALDFPVSPEALTLMNKLDAITVEANGRIYLAKDSRMSGETFRAGYAPGLARLEAVIARHGGSTRFASTQSQRLGL